MGDGDVVAVRMDGRKAKDALPVLLRNTASSNVTGFIRPTRPLLDYNNATDPRLGPNFQATLRMVIEAWRRS